MILTTLPKVLKNLFEEESEEERSRCLLMIFLLVPVVRALMRAFHFLQTVFDRSRSSAGVLQNISSSNSEGSDEIDGKRFEEAMGALNPCSWTTLL